jgi:hypothetical protein
MRFLSGFLIVFVLQSIQSFSFKAPLHAQCNVDWSWPSTPCKTIQDKILSQIKAWTTADNCKNGGEKCLYTLVSQTSAVIQATHKTPVKQYVDDLTFKFSGKDPQCNVNVSFIPILKL